MACKTETKSIDDIEYTVVQYPAKKALEFKFEVMRVIGPALTELIPSLTNKEDQAVLVGNAIEKLFSHVSPSDVVDLISTMLTSGHVYRAGKQLTAALFEEAFSGDNLSQVYRVLAFVLQVNYSNFLSGQKIGDLLTTAESQLTGGNTQT